jgi:hypothetical protein
VNGYLVIGGCRSEASDPSRCLPQLTVVDKSITPVPGDFSVSFQSRTLAGSQNTDQVAIDYLTVVHDNTQVFGAGVVRGASFEPEETAGFYIFHMYAPGSSLDGTPTWKQCAPHAATGSLVCGYYMLPAVR